MSDGGHRLPQVVGRYRVVRLLGHGAMGRVLLAHDPVLDRDVAIKHLRGDLSVLPDQKRNLIERMKQEARASARVSHPNIVALHDMGEDPEQGWYLVFEYVAGETLKARLERGPLPTGKVARLARELGSALSKAHKAGVLHRDIKPENVMLADTGAKIADFGIARVPDSTLTSKGKLLGTPAYSAPEAIANGRFSSKSDQFSLAATLYETLSGRRAFPGDDAVAVATKISTEEPPAIAAVTRVDPHTDVVFARALSKNPGARFETCEDFGNALGEALEMAPRSTMPTAPDYTRRLEESRRGRSRGVLIAMFSFGAGVGAATLMAPRLEANPVEVVTRQPELMEAEPVAWLVAKKRNGKHAAAATPSRTVPAPAAPSVTPPATSALPPTLASTRPPAPVQAAPAGSSAPSPVPSGAPMP